MTSSIVEIPEAGEQLPEWQITLHLYKIQTHERLKRMLRRMLFIMTKHAHFHWKPLYQATKHLTVQLWNMRCGALTCFWLSRFVMLCCMSSQTLHLYVITIIKEFTQCKILSGETTLSSYMYNRLPGCPGNWLHRLPSHPAHEVNPQGF